MATATFPVRNPSGLHARPAALFVKPPAKFACDVRVANLTRDPTKEVAARSLLAVLALGVSRGHEIRISAEGEDAEAAIASLGRLIESGLGEQVEAESP